MNFRKKFSAFLYKSNTDGTLEMLFLEIVAEFVKTQSKNYRKTSDTHVFHEIYLGY